MTVLSVLAEVSLQLINAEAHIYRLIERDHEVLFRVTSVQSATKLENLKTTFRVERDCEIFQIV